MSQESNDKSAGTDFPLAYFEPCKAVISVGWARCPVFNECSESICNERSMGIYRVTDGNIVGAKRQIDGPI